MTEQRTFECFVCKNNGFPNVMVVLAGKDERGVAIRKEPTGETHIHKTKLARGYNLQQQQVPMTQPLSREKTTRDEAIENMHKENQEGYAEYRKILKEQVDATRFLAEAIMELARAMRDKGAVQTET